MIYQLERFLKPFKLLLALNLTEDEGSDGSRARAQGSDNDVNPPSSSAAGLPVRQPSVTAPSGVMSTSEPEADVRVNWVYKMRKPRLRAELMKLGASAEGTSEQLKARLVRLVRQGVAKKPLTDFEDDNLESKDGATPSSPVEPKHSSELEATSIREILGLPPDADFGDVRRLLTRTTRPPTWTTAPPALRATGVKIPTAPLTGSDYSTRPTAAMPRLDDLSLSLPRVPTYELPASRMTETQYPLYPVSERYYPSRPYPPREDPREHRHADPPHVDRVPTASDTASLCNLVRKWNLRFDGRRDADAISFLERLHELMESYEALPEKMIKALPELLKDSAFLWYRNNRDFWVAFTDFLRDFQVQYLPPGYLLHLDDEIRKRTQGDSELFRQYVVAISTLIRRRGGFSEGEKLDRIYTNMHPNYKSYVRRRDFVNLPGLMKVAEEYEACLREKANYRPPPSPAQALVPETAYQGRSRPPFKAAYNTSSLMKAENEQPFREKRFESKAPHSSSSQEATLADSTPTRYRNIQPSTNRPEPVNNERRRYGDATSSRQQRPTVCWNCDKIGHLYRDCRRPKTLKCFNCKRPGVRTTSCDCLKQGNERGRRNTGVTGVQGTTKLNDLQLPSRHREETRWDGRHTRSPTVHQC